MGGFGSGNRCRIGAKSSTDDLRTIDVRRLACEGMLKPGHWGAWQWTRAGEVVASIRMRAEEDRVILMYRYRSGGEQWAEREYPVHIARTHCKLGGSRPWFICPALGCGRRVAILYSGTIFACRHCQQLAYASTREDAGDRATRRADRIRRRLGWVPGIIYGHGTKPKWMRWQTFIRLVEEHDRLVNKSVRVAALKLGLLRHQPETATAANHPARDFAEVGKQKVRTATAPPDRPRQSRR